MTKKILVTGCAGFIGSNFVKQYKKRYPKDTIVGIDDFSTGKKEMVDSEIIFYQGSITDEKLVEKIFSKHKPEYVFHFAALPRVSYSVEHPRETGLVNIIGTVTLLEACRKNNVKRFIFSSSCALYGNAKILPTKETSVINPQSPYAAQKYASEILCQTASRLSNVDTVCLRYFNVFGPGQYGDSAYSTVVSAWLEGLYFSKNKKPFIEGDGKQSRDFCYVDDVVNANILAMNSKKDFHGIPINIGSGMQISILEVKTLIETYTKKNLDLEKRKPRVGDVMHTKASIAEAQKLLGYNPKNSFEKNLKETVVWFEKRKK